MDWGEVNPTHAYYNGSCTSKDTEDPSWSTSFKTKRTQKTSSALEALWKTLFVLYLYLIGTLNMNPIATQHAALDNAWVPSKKRVKIERCNARIAFSKPQREETYQVTLEALKLSPCYPAF
ncbi:hypothetical protein Tco_1535172 [Tanacetum coccineum]